MPSITFLSLPAGYPIAAAVYEVLFALLFLLAVRRGVRRGFLSSLLALLSGLGSAVAGAWVAGQTGPTLYERYLGPAVGRELAAQLQAHGQQMTDALEALDILPGPLRSVLEEVLLEAGSDIAPSLTEALAPLLTPLVESIVFLLVFLVARLVLGALARWLRHINALPVLGQLNELLGGVAGAAGGLLDCWLLAMLLWVGANLTHGSYSFLTLETLSHSRLYSLFAAWNPFAG